MICTILVVRNDVHCEQEVFEWMWENAERQYFDREMLKKAYKREKRELREKQMRV